MRRKFLAIISLVLVCVTALSCLVGCTAEEGYANTDNTLIATDAQNSLVEIMTDALNDGASSADEANTSETTQKSTSKRTTVKPETDPVPGKSVAPSALTAKT